MRSKAVNKGMNGTGRSSARSFFKGVETLRDDTVIKEVYAAAKGLKEVWLVGGALRNLLLGAPLKDYDFVIGDCVEAFSAIVAARLGGSSFLLDEETSTYRVVVKSGDSLPEHTLDFAAIKDNDILLDLKKRDFTVNAMAVRLEEVFSKEAPEALDPAGGMEDSSKKVLRAVSKDAFDDDPLRCLRGVRLSQQYGLKIERETLKLIEAKAALLKDVSAERVREEVVLIFSNPGASASIRAMRSASILSAVLPEIEGWEDVDGYKLLKHSLSALDEAEKLLKSISERTFPGVHHNLKRHFEGAIGPVPRAAFFRFAAFFHDTGKPLTLKREEGRLRFIGHDFEGSRVVKDIMRRLKFSRKFFNDLSNVVKNHHRVFNLAKLEERTARAKAHLLRSTGRDLGVDLLCLALADARATRGGEDPELYGIVLDMLDFYYNTYVKKRPKPLLSGDDIMRIFKVAEGPRVGEIIAKVAEGVEAGVVKSKKDAVRYVKERMEV